MLMSSVGNSAKAPSFVACHYEDMDEAEFIAIIRTRMRELGVKQAELATLLWPGTQGSQWKISNLLAGKRKMTVGEYEALRQHFRVDVGQRTDVVPLIGMAAAGAWQEAILTPRRMIRIDPGSTGTNSFAVEVRGDSMDRVFPEGSIVIIDPDERYLFAGKIYLLENGDHEATIKKYMGDPARFEPDSTNPEHQPLFLSGIPHRVVGRITSSIMHH